MFSWKKTPVDSIVLVVTLLAHGCPVRALVAAFGVTAETVRTWAAEAGVHGAQVHRHLVLGACLSLLHVQADEMRVRMQPGGGGGERRRPTCRPDHTWKEIAARAGGIIHPHPPRNHPARSNHRVPPHRGRFFWKAPARHLPFQPSGRPPSPFLFKGGQKTCAMHISSSIRTPWQAGLEPAPASAARRGGQNSRLRIAMPENASLLKRSVRP
jgi:hypothetical protein